MEATVARMRDLIRDIPEHPQPGVTFKDITPLLADPGALWGCIEALASAFEGHGVDKVVGIEARGFILAAPVAVRLGAGFVPVRKAGKLPWEVHSETYDLEYGTDTLAVHADGVVPGDRVLIIDDVIATGGTAAATVELIVRLGATVVGLGFLVELGFLGGRRRLEPTGWGDELRSLVAYG